jgi:outer membrane protein TolC
LAEFGPALRLPIFSGGRLEGAYRQRRAAYDEAVATYQKVLARALADVADAIQDEKAVKAELAHAQQSLSADEDAYAIAKLRYQGGLSPYLNVLTAESAVLAERQTVIDLSVQSLTFDLSLVRALGGGYAEPHGTNSPASTR